MVFAKSLILTILNIEQSRYKEVTSPIPLPWMQKIQKVDKTSCFTKEGLDMTPTATKTI